MKQTAVDFLIYHIRQDTFVHSKSTKEWNQVFQQAKEMEKQRLEQFYNHGQWAIIEHGHGDTFEDYYIKTFKSE